MHFYFLPEIKIEGHQGRSKPKRYWEATCGVHENMVGNIGTSK